MVTRSKLVIYSILTGLFFTTGSWAHADPGIYQSVLGSTAWIINEEGTTSEGAVTGSGVLIDLEARLVATNYHVVGESKKVIVYFAAYDEDDNLVTEKNDYLKNFKAMHESRIAAVGKVVARWSAKDLALVQLDHLPAEAQAIPLAKDICNNGERVHTVGNPGWSGALWVYSPGEVRQRYESRAELSNKQKLQALVLETTSPVNGGDSGGPVVNDRNELVAIVSSYKPGARLITHAIDIQELRKLIEWFYDNNHDPETPKE